MRRMNYLRLSSCLVSGSLVLVAVSGSGLAQTSSPNAPGLDPATELEQSPTAPENDSQTLTQPLEVNQQQADQFFSPAPRPQIVERATSSDSSDGNLIEPPPGSQTPAQVTPGQRLNLQIR